MAVKYVKFVRGSSLAFENVINKDSDTLYFITDSNSGKGSLYLGDKLISGNISDLVDLQDVLVDELADGHLLIYNELEGKWVNKTAIDAIGLMTKATDANQGGAGLVPAPGIGQQNYFLRGDGTWALPESVVQLFPDDKTIEVSNENILFLKNFGIKYYKYIPESGSIEDNTYVASHYELQIVDNANPWIEGLEPKVVEEEGQLVLGWFEPNPTTLEGVVDELTSLQKQIDDVEQSTINNAKFSETIAIDLNTLKNNVYNKTETENLISQSIVAADHLKRKTFLTLKEAEEFAQTLSNPDTYIYMVLDTDSSNASNRYIEYLYVEGKLEQIGSWDTSLEDYVTDSELTAALAGKVSVQEGYSLISNVDVKKLSEIEAGAQKNYITSVEVSEFNVDEAGKLSLLKVPVSKIENLNTLLPDFTAVSDNFVITTVNGIKTLDLSKSYVETSIYTAEVGDLSTLVRASGKEDSTLVDEINYINARLQWTDLG